MKVYCIFCKSGSENSIAEKIAKVSPELETIIPVRTLQEKRQGGWVSTKHHLIPGYIFLYAEERLNLQHIKRLMDVYKILDDGSGSRELAGADYQYAMWVYKHIGNIGSSKIMVEGSEVLIIDGPLKDGVGKLLRIDRHKRRAWVEFDFQDRTHTVSLSIDDVTSYIA